MTLPNCLQVEGKGGFSKLMQKVSLELNSVAWAMLFVALPGSALLAVCAQRGPPLLPAPR